MNFKSALVAVALIAAPVFGQAAILKLADLGSGPSGSGEGWRYSASAAGGKIAYVIDVDLAKTDIDLTFARNTNSSLIGNKSVTFNLTASKDIRIDDFFLSYRLEGIDSSLPQPTYDVNVSGVGALNAFVLDQVSTTANPTCREVASVWCRTDDGGQIAGFGTLEGKTLKAGTTATMSFAWTTATSAEGKLRIGATPVSTPVPVPAALPLALAAFAGLGLVARRRG